MDIKFENNIPIPLLSKQGKYAFLNEMKVGQSFVIPIISGYIKDTIKWRNQFHYRKWKCSIRKVDDNNMRIWRTK